MWYSELAAKSVSNWKKGKQRRTDLLFTSIDSNAVVSSMTWKLANPGSEAPPFWPRGHLKEGTPMTFDDWIICQDYFDGTRSKDIDCEESSVPSIEREFKKENMWSPRRGHAAIAVEDDVFVIGGRSREHVRVDDERLVGGVIGNRVESRKDFLTVREQTVLKNDIWVSRKGSGGKEWTLITPGCKDPQEDILIRTEIWTKERLVKDSNTFAGSASGMCTKSSDCYGDAVCKSVKGSRNKICVCPMFSVREHHSVSVQHRYFRKENNATIKETYMYLVGGFTNVRQNFCADRSCGFRGSYRMALDDAWVSTDGANWLQIKSASGATSFKARGSHSAVLMHANLFREPEAMDRLWIFGGENVNPNSTSSEYLNDIWTLNLSTKPCCITKGSCDLLSSPTLTHSDIDLCFPQLHDWQRSEINVPWNGRAGHISIHEPPSSLNAFKDLVYIIGGQNESMVYSDVWYLDVSTSKSWILDGNSSSTAKNVLPTIRDNNHTLQNHLHQFHFDMNSTLESLVSSYLPVTKYMENEVFEETSWNPMFSENDIHYLRNSGFISLADLLFADQRQMLALRDFVDNICYVRALVEAFRTKCTVDVASEKVDILLSCQGTDDFEECISNMWDGCSAINGYSYINVHGIGIVEVPTEIPTVSSDLENMFCKQTPGPRYMPTGHYISGSLLILGGQSSTSTILHRDVWSRDDSAPLATIKVKPKSGSSQSIFRFECDEDGALQFEYKIFDFTERLDVTPWLVSVNEQEVDISWLDSKKGGPGSGFYTLYVRAGETRTYEVFSMSLL